MADQAKLMTVGELSHYFRVHRSTVYRLLKKGRLPGFKIGSDWRFNVEVIERWRLGMTADEHPDAQLQHSQPLAFSGRPDRS